MRGRSWWFWVGVWWPAVVAVLCIATESQPRFGADHTSSWLRPIFERLFGPIGESAWQEGHHLFRKTGHFLGYGTVGLTFLRGWLYALARGSGVRWRLRACGLGVLCTAVVAGLDEWHQTFLPNRTGAVSDVLLDTLGAVVLMGLVWVGLWRGEAIASQGVPPR